MIWEAIILAHLLLLLGYGLYHYLLRTSLSLVQRKYSLLLILSLALLLPWLTGELRSYFVLKSPASSYTAWNVVDIEDVQLMDCYEKASSSAEVCTCEVQQQQEQVYFDYQPLSGFFVQASRYALYIGAFMALLLFIRLLWGIYGLWRISQRAEAQPASFEGFSFYPISQAAGGISAFSLGKHYLISGPNWQCYGEKEQEAILAHELCHLRQGDAYWRMVWGFLHCFFFCHPLFYSLRSEFVLLCELLADSKAAQRMPSAKAYAQLLLKVQQNRQKHRYTELSLALGQHHLRSRIVYLLQAEESPSEQQASWRIALAVGTMLLSCGCYGLSSLFLWVL